MSKPKYVYIKSTQTAKFDAQDKKMNGMAGKLENVKEQVKGHHVEPIYCDIELNENKKIILSVHETHNSSV